MQYTKLGRTGLDVSRLCLGCMSYGGGNSGFHQWALGEEESRPFIKKALDAGINFFDTAIATRSARARRFSATRSTISRDAMKWSSPPRSLTECAPARMAPNFVLQKHPCSRSMRACAGSAPIMSDLYQIHRFDHETPDRRDDGRRCIVMS